MLYIKELVKVRLLHILPTLNRVCETNLTLAVRVTLLYGLDLYLAHESSAAAAPLCPF